MTPGTARQAVSPPAGLPRRVRSGLGFARLMARYAAGWVVFGLTGRTPHGAYDGMRQLYCRTDGRMNDLVGRLLGLLHPRYRIDDPRGVLGELDRAAIRRIAASIRERGFYVFPQRLPADRVEVLRAFALRQPAFPYDERGRGAEKVVYDPERWISTKYEFDEPSLFGQRAVQRLAADPSMLAVAQEYLAVQPVLDLVSMWWSTAYSPEASSQAAQLYHFDMDRNRFLKFFFYLSDVGPGNGPHVYVAGSAQRKPRPLRRDGRFDDDEIARHYRAEETVEITGERGTIFAADTRGLHKGKPLRSGDRLLLQLEFADSLFGQSYETLALPAGVDERLLAAARRYRRTYRRLEGV